MGGLQRIKAGKEQTPLMEPVSFVKEGEKNKKSTITKNLPNFLQRASDWRIRVALKEELIFPEHIGSNNFTLARIDSALQIFENNPDSSTNSTMGGKTICFSPTEVRKIPGHMLTLF